MAQELRSLSSIICKQKNKSDVAYVFGPPRKPNYDEEKNKFKKIIAQKYHPKKIKLKAADNKQLAAYLIERPSAKRVIILCHGYWQAKEFMHEFLDLFAHDTIYIPDLRAHGDSQGKFISFGYYETQDIKSGIQFLLKNPSTKKLPIIGFGISMGALILLKAVSEGMPFKALILDSALTDINNTLCYIFRRWGKFPFCMCDMIVKNFEKLTQMSTVKIDPKNIIKKRNNSNFIYTLAG